MLGFLFALSFEGCGSGDSGYGAGHAKVSLLSEKRTVTPGWNALFGVRFEIEPGWHLYWKGQNDTGYAPHLTLQLPEGFRAGDVLWPVPKRLVSPGNILDHVYDGQVTLLFPVSVPPDAKPGRYEIKGEASWLACHEACVPGKETVHLSISVGNDAETAQLNREIEDARAALPLSWEAGNQDASIQSTWQYRTLIFKRPGASRMLFFPDTASVGIKDLIPSGDVEGDEIRLTAQDSTGQISGILGIETPRNTIYCSVRVPLPEKPPETR